MKITQAKINELWILRARFFSNRKQSAWGTFMIPPFLMFIGPIALSKFDNAIIKFSLLSYCFFLLFMLIIIYELKKYKRKNSITNTHRI